MGSVYEAFHERMDRRVAIKVINAALVDHPEALRRFDQEVRTAAKLDHPNVARAYDADEFGAVRVLVMEFVAGQSLEKFLAKRGRLSVVDACRLVRQALVGLQHASDRGMVHRDLKPHNLMLTPDGKVKILDFGLAKIASERRRSDKLTRDNALMGTPLYLAPEQALDAAQADIRADIYSLGCTLYCLLTGAPPFDGDTEMKVLMAHQNETPRPLSEVRGDVPQAFSDLVERMLAKKPANRPQTPKEVAEALLPFARGDSVVSSKPSAERAAGEAAADPLAFLTKDRPIAPAVPSRRAAKPKARPQRGRFWTSLGALAAAFAFAAWAIVVIIIRTQQGTIIIRDVPSDAEVTIDGNKVTLKQAGEEMHIEALDKGDHELKITLDGKSVWTKDVKLESGGQTVQVRYEPTESSAERRSEIHSGNPDAQARHPGGKVLEGGLVRRPGKSKSRT